MLGRDLVQQPLVLIGQRGEPRGGLRRVRRRVRTAHAQQIAHILLADPGKQTAQLLFAVPGTHLVIFHKYEHPLARGIVAAQSPQRRVRNARARRRMAGEAAVSGLRVISESLRLAAVVKERREPEDALGRDRVHGMRRVVPYVPAMVLRTARIKPPHRRKLRQEHEEHLRKGEQHLPRAARAEDTLELRENAFRGDVRQKLPVFAQRRGGLLLDGQAEPCRKAQRAQNAQRILPEALARVADAAQDAVFQILPPAEIVPHTARRAVRHGVHRKIAPREIGMDIAHKGNAVRVTAVGVAALGAKGRDLDGPGRREQRKRAVLQAGFDHALAGKDLFHLLRRRGRAEIPVMRLDAEQRIAHTPAHGIALPPGTLELFQCAGSVFRQLHHDPSPSITCQYTTRRAPPKAPRR